VEITVPNSVRVVVSDVGILGEFIEGDTAGAREGSPVVLNISGVALLGSVTVTSVPAPAPPGQAASGAAD
jgi:hypothetical protein